MPIPESTNNEIKDIYEKCIIYVKENENVILFGDWKL